MRPQTPTALLSALYFATIAAAFPGSVSNRGDEAVFIHEIDGLASKNDYTTGAVHMSMMNAMQSDVDDIKTSGIIDYLLLEPLGYTPCIDGFSGTKINHTYACKNLDLVAFMPHALLGSTERIGNDIWGWTSADGREFGLVGQMDGTAFVEIVNGEVVYLGRLPTQTYTSIWRDIKVIGTYAYIGSEALGHGIQVFDLTKLLDRSLAISPITFSIQTDLTSLYELPVGSSHNIVAHESKNLIVAVGSLPRDVDCKAGLIFVDVTDPSNPQSAGCASADGYVHDAQCLTYHGPHVEFEGTDVCYSFNEDTFTIYNVSNPFDPLIISATHYYGVSYSHQGWVVNEADQKYLLLDDELDEFYQRGWASDNKTVTYIWSIEDLRSPILTGHYKSPAKAIDHNLYTLDGWAYESNYMSGLRVVDVSSVNEDPTGAGFEEVAFFDVHPEDDSVGGIIQFGGAWSVYPYFESKMILVNSMERGLFVLQYVV